MPEKKLNILYHFRVRGTGAEGVHIAGIVNGFRALGHNVFLISPTDADPTTEPPARKPSNSPFSIKRVILHKLADVLPQPFFEFMEIAYNIIAIPKLWRAVSRRQIDFIYERYAFFNFSGAFISKRKNIPLILEVNELSGLKRVRGQFFVRFCSAIEKYVLRKAVIVVTVSDFLNQKVSEKVDSRKTKVVTIPNGVPLAWLKRETPLDTIRALRKRYELQGEQVICFVGGLVHWHNFDLLLQAVKKVQNRLVNDVVLMLIGDGPLKNYIENKARDLDFKPGLILFIGKVPHSDIPSYLKMADVGVIPATNDFRSPIKMFEYMAMGLPVVAPRMPAIEAIIEDGIDGLLFEPGDVDSLAEEIIHILSDDKLSDELGKLASRKINQYYTWEQDAKSILLLLKHQLDCCHGE